MTRTTMHNADHTRLAIAPTPRAGVRRGSALIIVVGVLALVAVLSAIYISIGQADTRTAAALETRRERQDISAIAGGHAAHQIARDRLDTYYMPSADTVSGGVTAQTSRREAFDYPYTDYSVRSVVTSPSARWRLFNPSGRHTLTGAQGPAFDNDPRVPYDPWLSSTMPEYLGPADLSEDTALPNGRFSSRSRRRSYWLDNRDWRHISNLSPDGRFVNLINLRPDRGGFDAEPGYGLDDDNDPRMTYDLSLLGAPPGGGELGGSAIHAFDPTVDGVWFPGAEMPADLIDPLLGQITGDELYNVPAVWDSNQRFMFMPMNQAFFIYDRNGQVADWSSPDFPAYQYADADGDGMADSRWFELTDASDPMAIDPLINDPDYRVFMAARVQDLSALVNVNTAGDQTIAPTLDYPTGSSLSEIDLRRLLMMSDQGQNYNAVGKLPPTGNGGLSFQHMDHPPSAGTGGDPTQIYRGPSRAPADRLLGYDALRPTTTTAVWQLSPSAAEMLGVSTGEVIGQLAYDAIRIAIDREITPDDGYYGVFDSSVPGPLDPSKRLIRSSNFWYDDAAIDPDRVSPVMDINDRAERRAMYAREIGSRDITRPGEYLGTVDGLGAALFGLNDLSELLTYRGINDPASTSRLETVVSGVLENGQTGTAFSTRRLSPLLSNRPLFLDRFGHGDGAYRTSSYPLVEGEIDWQSMALFALSPRQWLTTYSGGVATRDHEAMPGSALTGAALSPTVAGLVTSPEAAFRVFASALAPYSDVPGAWANDMRTVDPNDTMHTTNPYRPLNYGGISAEQALLLAAHTALNVSDLYDGDSEPSAATVMLDLAIEPDLDLESSLAPTQADQRRFPWWDADEGEFDPDTLGSGLPPSGTIADVRRQAKNVFGVEPQPFLIEASAIVVFTDAPTSQGGDTDFTSLPSNPAQIYSLLVEPPGVPGAGSGLSPTSVSNITIDTTLQWKDNPFDPGNSDFVLQALAFKLYNPFDEPISVNGNMIWDEDEQRWDEWDYYIEFAGRFYMLGDVVEFEDGASGATDMLTEAVAADVVQHDPIGGPAAGTGPYRGVSIAPGESRVFYVLANNALDNGEDATAMKYDSKTVDDRWDAIMTAYNDPRAFRAKGDQSLATGLAVDYLKVQLGSGSARIKEFDPETGKTLNPTGDPVANTGPWRDIFRPALPGGRVPVTRNNPDRISTSTVRLWRRMTDPNGETIDPATGLNDVNTFNIVENDLLADRLSADVDTSVSPVREPLNPHQPIETRGNADVTNTISFNEDLDVASNPCSMSQAYDNVTNELKRNDNTGWTIALWGSIRRPYDVIDRGLGHLPPGMIEVRNPDVAGTAIANYKNIALRWDDDFNATEGLANLINSGMDAMDFARLCSGEGSNYKEYESAIDFRTNRNAELKPSLSAMRDLDRRGGEPAPMYTMSIDVERAGDNGGNPGAADYATRLRDKFDIDKRLGQNAYGESINYGTPAPLPSPQYLAPELFTSNGKVDPDALRPADILLALGVGPVQSPHPNRSAGYDPDAEWITLAEMIAIALGYDVPVADDPSYTPTDDAEAALRLDDPYVGMVNDWFDIDGDGDTSTMSDPADRRYVLPGAQLAIDDFVPFFDLNDDGIFTPPSGPGLNDGDIRAGMGIPMALDAVSRVRMHAPVQPASVPNTAWNELTRPVFGTININTAPVHVLRMLPGLAPNLDTFDANDDQMVVAASDAREWWVSQYDASGASNLPTLGVSFGDFTTRPDAAATIAAYRDRVYPTWRPMSDPNGDNAGTKPDVTSTQLRFDPFVSGLNDYGAVNGDNMRSDAGRAGTTGIRGLRETPGFRGIGEVLAVTLRERNEDGTPNANFADYRHLTVQALGLDKQAQGVVDVKASPTSTEYTASIETDTYASDDADEITDDLGERLAVANGILGSVSVSSDIYAVWYIVQAYKRSDVEDLRPGDPLVPSYARRYVMVLDRSNVVTEDDQPRIVLLKEVPM